MRIAMGAFMPSLPATCVEPRELRLAFDVEREDLVLERQLDFRLGLADAGEDAAFDVRAGHQHPPELAAADEIETRAQVGEVTQDRDVGVGLHRVADLDIKPGQAAGQPRVVVGHRRRAVDVGGRAVEAGDLGEVDGLAVKVGTGVAEVVHRRSGKDP
jgi:hypothetical protein